MDFEASRDGSWFDQLGKACVERSQPYIEQANRPESAAVARLTVSPVATSFGHPVVVINSPERAGTKIQKY